eukprot:gene4417-3216_t
MSTLTSRIAAMLGLASKDEALSVEVARNAAARAHLAEQRHHALEEKLINQQKIEQEEQRVKMSQNAYQQQAAPLIAEFDSLAPAGHSYESFVRWMGSHAHMAQMIADREGDHYGFIGKKLISVSLHFKALKEKVISGEPFQKELEATLEDAERDDLRVVATSLREFASSGVPTDIAARAEAFILSQSMEGTFKTEEQQPLHKWLDFLRFRTSLSPTDLEENRLQAHRNAKAFMEYTKEKEYIRALEVVEKHRKLLGNQQDPMMREFNDHEKAFRTVVDPIIATKMFLMYGDAAITCRRFANVEQLLSS